jgi:hypothetical protein
MKKLAAACTSAVLAAVLTVVIAVSGSGGHKAAPTAGSSWAKLPGISLGSLGSILGL